VAATRSLYRALSLCFQQLHSRVEPDHPRLLLLLFVPDEEAQSRADNTLLLADRDDHDTSAIGTICESTENITRHESTDANTRHLVG